MFTEAGSQTALRLGCLNEVTSSSMTTDPASTFTSATAMTRDEPNQWTGEIVDGWDIAGNANGGYLLALAARALCDATRRPDPITITAHYLAPGRPGPVQIRPEIHKAGRRFTTASGVLGQNDRAVLSVMGSFGDVRALAEPTHGTTPAPRLVDGSPPDLPPFDPDRSRWPDGGFVPAISEKIDLQLHPDDQGFAAGHPSGDLVIRGWFALRDDEPIDTVALLLAVDAFPPTAFNGNLPVAWTPTVELTTHIRAVPARGPLACAFRSRFLQGSFIETDGEVWDPDGNLCAQSRQLALVPQSDATT